MRSPALPLCLLVLALACDSAPKEVPASAPTPASPPAAATVAAPARPAPRTPPPAPAPEGSWVEFSSKPHGFRAEFPVAPKNERMKVPTVLGELEMEMFVVDQEPRAFIVSVLDALPSDEPIVAARVLDGARDGAVANIQGKLIREEQILQDGLPARRLEISAGTPDAPLRVESLLVLRERKLYQVLAVAPASDGDAKPTIARFFASLRMI